MTRFEAGKEYRTPSGYRARVYATDAGGDYPIHGAVFMDSKWYLRSWASGGKVVLGIESDMDLIPEPREYWLIGRRVYDAEFVARCVADTLSADAEIIHVREVLK